MSLALNDSPVVATRMFEHPIEVWTHVHRWIDRALDHEFGLITAVDVFNALIAKKMALWGVYRDGDLVAAFVTQIERGTRGKALNVIALGGDGMADWLDLVCLALDRHAVDEGCRYVFQMGRSGWLRTLDKRGWVRGPDTMIRVV